MAPEYEKAAKKLEVFKDQVLIAKVNCDVEKDLARRFNIGGYPTLLWYPKGSKNHESYNSGRDAQSILNWVERKTGLRVPYKSVPAIKDYTREEFEAFINDSKSSGIVMFYAPCKHIAALIFVLGCGHCKKLKPIYGEVTKAFENEPKCKVIAINGDVHRDLVEKYGITGYPSLKLFKANDKSTPIDYTGSQELEKLVDYLNEQCGTFRNKDGRLMPEAGVRIDIEEKIKELLKSNSPVNEEVLGKEFGNEDR